MKPLLLVFLSAAIPGGAPLSLLLLRSSAAPRTRSSSSSSSSSTSSSSRNYNNHGRGVSSSAPGVVGRNYGATTKLLLSSSSLSSSSSSYSVAEGDDAEYNNNDAEDNELLSSSDLKALLPTPRRRTLTLDKYGRRVHDLTDDGTAKYRKERSNASSSSVARMPSDADIAASSLEGEGVAAESPSLSKILNDDDGDGDGEGHQAKSAKELAAEASSADFGREVRYSSDLKALLPKQKMMFMKLDKFGRRIQRMEDDGTVNMKKEPRPNKKKRPAAPSPGPGPSPVSSDTRAKADDDEEEGDNNIGGSVVSEGPSLAELLGKMDEGGRERGKEDAPSEEEEENPFVNLKELLPKQKMRFMKLDKLGRRVQRMEDDGTVNMKKEPGIGYSTGPRVAPHRGTREGFSGDSNIEEVAEEEDSDYYSTGAGGSGDDGPDYGNLKELLSGGGNAAADWDAAGTGGGSSGKQNYGNLKQLLPKRPIWTKLDFHGAPVEDERRTKRVDTVRSDAVSSGSGLADLLPKRAMWTKLDFHGASVEDERRTKKVATRSGSEIFNKGSYSNLNSLLPERKIKWRKQGELLSSGSASSVSENVRGLREERQQAMREEVIASINENISYEEEEDDDESTDDGSSGTADFNTGSYSNLKTLLPERKIKWRKQGELLSSGSSPIVSENVRGLREERQHAMSEDVISFGTESDVGEEDENDAYDAAT